MDRDQPCKDRGELSIRVTSVTPEILHERGLIKKAKHDLVILGNGDVSKSLNISAHRFTKTAKDKIEKAGGRPRLITKETAEAQLRTLRCRSRQSI